MIRAKNAEEFQSPWSGQICLNLAKQGLRKQNKEEFQSPWSGQICLNSLKDYFCKGKISKII